MSSDPYPGTAELVCEVVAGGRLPHGSSVAQLTVRGVPALLAYRLNVAEAERRARKGVGPVLDPAELEGLSHLPVGLPVAAESLTPRERRLFRRCPPDVVERRGSEFVRRLAAPLEVDLAVVRAVRPSRGALLRAGRFGAYTASAVWLDGPAAGSELLVMEAGVYGLGVACGHGGAVPELLVAPRSSSHFRHTTAGWLFAEQVYGELTAARRIPRPMP